MATLVGLHVHVWPGAVVAHRLALSHVHLALGWHALGGGDGVVVAAHGSVAAGGHVHGPGGHVGRLVGAGSGSLHGHMVRSWKFRHQYLTRKKYLDSDMVIRHDAAACVTALS